MRIFCIIIVFGFVFQLSSSQNVTSIDSFSCNAIKGDMLLYVVETHFLLDNGHKISKVDTFVNNSIELNRMLKIDYLIKDSLITINTCLTYENLKKCYADSLILFIPVKKVRETNAYDISDALASLDFSILLFKLNEPLLNKAKLPIDVLRIVWLDHSSAEVFRLEYKGNDVKLTYKCVNWTDKVFEVKNDTTFSIEPRLYSKILGKISNIHSKRKAEDWCYDSSNLLVESYVHGRYNCVNEYSDKGWTNHSEAMKCLLLIRDYMLKKRIWFGDHN